MVSSGKLRIVHCFRAPAGGVFRHVRDLAGAQREAGHEVGIICDSTCGGEHDERLLGAVSSNLALGLIRIPMRRAVTPRDLATLAKAYFRTRRLRPDVVHAHGAKGGAYARAIGTVLRISGQKVARVYCPHGGSIHFDAAMGEGKFYFALERILERMTDRLIFVSQYERDRFADLVGQPQCPTSLVYNGLAAAEFEPVEPAPEAADFLFVGTIRDLKGPDIFLKGLALAQSRAARPIYAHLVGDGEDKPACLDLIRALNLGNRVTVHGAMPSRAAFALARYVVVPSRAESMPYIVLEAIAAGRPVIATNVGGIPEIFGSESGRLIPPGDAPALAAEMLKALRNPERPHSLAARRGRLAEHFSIASMANAVEEAYRASL